MGNRLFQYTALLMVVFFMAEPPAVHAKRMSVCEVEASVQNSFEKHGLDIVRAELIKLDSGELTYKTQYSVLMGSTAVGIKKGDLLDTVLSNLSSKSPPLSG